MTAERLALDARREYLVVSLGPEFYAMELLAIQEVRGLSPVTTLPKAPDFVRGLLNLRGAVVPVVDLGSYLGKVVGEPPPRQIVVVATHAKRVVGIIVDAVSDVVVDEGGGPAPLPELVEGRVRHVKGLIKRGDDMVVVLDLTELFETATFAMERSA